MVTAKDRSDILTAVFAVITAASISSLVIVENVDTDIWWHIGIGRHIIDTLAIPTANLYSVLQYGEPFHDSYWLFEVVVAAVDRASGIPGVQVLTWTLWTLILILVYRTARVWCSPRVVLSLLFLASWASSVRFVPRPEVVTYLMVSAFSYLLQNRYPRPRHFILFFALQVIWTNAHGLFVFGPFLSGSYLIAALLSRTEEQRGQIRNLTALTALLVLATVLPPAGIDGWKYAYHLYDQVSTGGPELSRRIYEFMPSFSTTVRETPNIWSFAILLALSIITSATALLRRGGLPVHRTIICAAFAVQAVLHQRNIPLFAIVAVPLVCENLQAAHTPLRISDLAVSWCMVLMIAVSLLSVSGWYHVHFKYPYRLGIGVSPVRMPHDLADFLRREQFRGTIYNSNAFGGYLLYNGYLPLTDGRFSDYDPERFVIIEAAPHNRQLWENIVSLYQIKGALLQHGSPEARALIPDMMSDERWKLAYYDHTVSFWVRNEGPWRSTPQADLSWLSASRYTQLRIEVLLNLSDFLASMRQHDQALRCLDEALRMKQRMPYVLERKARLELESGRIPDHERTLEDLLLIDPENTFGLIQTAVSAVYNGDYIRAGRYFDRICGKNADDQQAQAICARYRSWMSLHKEGWQPHSD